LHNQAREGFAAEIRERSFEKLFVEETKKGNPQRERNGYWGSLVTRESAIPLLGTITPNTRAIRR